MNNSDMPANGCSLEVSERYEQGFYDQPAVGLTKREHFAGLAMQGLLARVPNRGDTTYPSVAIQSIYMADALLKELDK